MDASDAPEAAVLESHDTAAPQAVVTSMFALVRSPTERTREREGERERDLARTLFFLSSSVEM